MSFETLRLEQDGQIAVLTLNRPEKRNAISPEMITELLDVFDEVEYGATKALILTGAGQAFCAGMDLQALKNFEAPSQEQLIADARRISEVFQRLYSFSKPSVAAVNGVAVAGGCGLATLCDFTLATPGTKFGYTEVRVGFIPALVAAYLVRQIGEKPARSLLLSGRIFDAAEAKTMGLVNEIVEPEKLLPRAWELATSLAEMSPVALGHTKRLLRSFSEAELLRETELAIEASARVRGTEDFREGLTSFLEKRKPKWGGR